jgi:hypothetical protein
VTHAGSTATYYYDVNTGYKVRTIQSDKPGAPSADFSDYRDVNGVKFPYHIISDEGEVVLDLTVQDIKVNSGLTDADFH